MGHLVPSSSDNAPAAQPAGPGRATDEPPEEALGAALAACAVLADELATLHDPATQRQRMRQLPNLLQAAVVALARLERAAGPESPGDAGVDALTGLGDRCQLQVAGNRSALQHPDTPQLLLAVDIDHLRHVNDTWSHATGDAVVQVCADVLRAQSRPQDVLARTDANLFVVALGGPVSTTRALLVAERLRAAIEAHAWDGVRSGLRVTACIGVTGRAPGEPLEAALARAGDALQDCKRGGRNQVRSRP